MVCCLVFATIKKAPNILATNVIGSRILFRFKYMVSHMIHVDMYVTGLDPIRVGGKQHPQTSKLNSTSSQYHSKQLWTKAPTYVQTQSMDYVRCAPKHQNQSTRRDIVMHT